MTYSIPDRDKIQIDGFDLISDKGKWAVLSLRDYDYNIYWSSRLDYIKDYHRNLVIILNNNDLDALINLRKNMQKKYKN